MTEIVLLLKIMGLISQKLFLLGFYFRFYLFSCLLQLVHLGAILPSFSEVARRTILTPPEREVCAGLPESFASSSAPGMPIASLGDGQSTRSTALEVLKAPQEVVAAS